jgi:hypothetical protein
MYLFRHNIKKYSNFIHQMTQDGEEHIDISIRQEASMVRNTAFLTYLCYMVMNS